jgi:hypothetical protein
MKHTAKMIREKETKNCVRFVEQPEQGKAPVLGTIYVPKWVVGDKTVVLVTVEVQ